MPRNGSGTASIVNTFTPLTTADANDVNENFTDIATMITDSLPRDGQAGMSGQLLAISGTVTQPGIAFNADTNTGIRRPAGDQLALVCGGVDVATATSTGVSVSVAPTADEHLTNKEYVDSLLANASFPGDVKMTARSTPPTGWLECNGAAVLIATYPDLDEAIYVGDALNATAVFGYRCTNPADPSNSRLTSGTHIVLPDTRGEFVRGWDHGKGTDSGRAFASSQQDALQNITGSFEMIRSAAQNATGAFTSVNITGAAFTGGTTDGGRVTFNASLVARTSTETRPRNLALMYIIKT